MSRGNFGQFGVLRVVVPARRKSKGIKNSEATSSKAGSHPAEKPPLCRVLARF
jgi:hypothetical protein